MDESRSAPHDVEPGTVNRRTFVKSTGAAGLLVAAAGTLAPKASASRGPAIISRRSARYVDPPPADTKARLTTFNYGGEADQLLYSNAIKRFNERYKNVQVKDNYTPFTLWSEYANKLTTTVAGGQVPDLIHVAIEGTRLVIANGLLEPLDEYIAGDAAMQATLANEMAQPLKDAFTVDGKLYQIPVEWNNMVIYYNTKLFAVSVR